MEALFWLSAAALVYGYVGYAAILALWATIRHHPVRRRRWTPSVSVVVCAHDEAAGIEARLENLLALDYPADRLEVLVGSDGSTDGTAARARAVADPRVLVLEFPTRQGKPAVLNRLIALARGEIVVLADARQAFDRDALRALVAPFADRRVGAVSGRLALTPAPGSSAGGGVGFYWRCETFIRERESRIDSTIGATGAIYAIRRALFRPIPGDTILDDVLIPLDIARRGHRVIFEPAAVAYDRAARSFTEERTRKTRTIAGNFQLFARHRWLLDPRGNRLWVQTMSHKGLRLLFPPLHLATLGANAALAGESPFYGVALGGQMVFYLAALAGQRWPVAARRSRLLSIPATTVTLLGATVVGFGRFVSGRQTSRWERSPRPTRPANPQYRPPTLASRR